MKENFYDFNKLKRSYRSVGLKKNDSIYLTGDLFLLGQFKPTRKILYYHFKAITDLIGKGGTISFPTFSYSLAKNKKIFSLEDTPSETGALTEYLRKKKGSIRQVHPYSSITSLGKNAKFICTNNSKHAYGYDSPFQRLYELNAKYISLGIKPNLVCSLSHHVETILNVPYRFTKEFNHIVKLKDKKKIKEKFYLFVLYNYLRKIPKDKHKKIFKNFKKKNKIYKAKCGQGFIYSYSIKKFQDTTVSLLKKNMYSWMSNEPRKKIWDNF